MSIMSIYQMGFQSSPDEKKKSKGKENLPGGSYKNGGKIKKTKHRAKTTYGRHKGY